MATEKVTRGFGLLEKFLSIQRMKKAINLIKNHNKNGNILDIGCGSYPIFLLNIDFQKKYGIDQEIKDKELKHLNLHLKKYNILKNSKFPFKSNYFDVITMLAVIEHLKYNQISSILKECYNILKKDGILIITTPAKWSNSLLKIMAKLHVVSPKEIEEHKNAFTLKELNSLMLKANFKQHKIEKGFFEFSLNMWICAKK